MQELRAPVTNVATSDKTALCSRQWYLEHHDNLATKHSVWQVLLCGTVCHWTALTAATFKTQLMT